MAVASIGLVKVLTSIGFGFETRKDDRHEETTSGLK
jgi:hypothetical protein